MTTTEWLVVAAIYACPVVMVLYLLVVGARDRREQEGFMRRIEGTAAGEGRESPGRCSAGSQPDPEAPAGRADPAGL